MNHRPRTSRIAAVLGVACAGACLAGCGQPSEMPSPGGVWRYGITEADLRPMSGGSSGGGVVARSDEAKSPAGPASSALTPSPATPVAPTPPAAASPSSSRAPAAWKVQPVAGGGSIRARCSLTEPAKLAPLSIFKDNALGCGDPQHPSERAVFDAATLGLGNCVVQLRGIEAGKDWDTAERADDRTILLDQHGCVYRPHVGVVRAGTQMVVLNSDRADHNIHGFRLTLADTMFNIASEPGTRKDVDQAFYERPGSYPIKCDIHPWMSAYVLVVPTPYFGLTSAAEDAARGTKPGEALLLDVPPGTYELECWHEGMTETPQVSDGRIAAYGYSPPFVETQKVTVTAGAEAQVEFRIPPR